MSVGIYYAVKGSGSAEEVGALASAAGICFTAGRALSNGLTQPANLKAAAIEGALAAHSLAVPVEVESGPPQPPQI